MTTPTTMTSAASTASLAEHEMTIGFIGTGNMGSALARAEADTLALLCDRLELSGHQARLAGKILHAGFRRLQKQPVQVLKGLEDPRRQEEYTRMLTRLFGPEEGERSEEWN